MAICYEDGALARFAGAATVEEALDFAGWMAGTEAPQVDLVEAGSIHAAVLQCLLAFRPTLRSLPADAFLSACLADLPKATPTQNSDARTE